MTKDKFERVEIKYRLSKEQYDEIRKRLEPYMKVDEYGVSRITSIYFDTPGYDLIRESLEKPVYKEKFRLRGYGKINDDSTVFLELKKKYKRVVYKRRVALKYKEAIDYIEKGIYPKEDSQILKEIDYFINYYKPTSKTYISCERIALYGIENKEIRITFDKDIVGKLNEGRFVNVTGASPLLDPGERLMEIKVPDALPLWLTGMLNDLKIYPQSFSKYGNACTTLIDYDNRAENGLSAPENDNTEYAIDATQGGTITC